MVQIGIHLNIEIRIWIPNKTEQKILTQHETTYVLGLVHTSQLLYFMPRTNIMLANAVK